MNMTMPARGLLLLLNGICMMGPVDNVNGEPALTVEDLDAQYVSSEDPGLRLYATFLSSGDQPKPILLYLPGWHGNRYYVHRDLRNNTFMLDRFFLVAADMRGRGAKGDQPFGGTPDASVRRRLGEGPVSDGTPDANGWELNDIIDAAEFAKKKYPQHALPDPVYVIGHSGGGGNAMGLVGKFPDYFTAAYAGSGMSDYGRWAELYAGLRGDVERYVGARINTTSTAFASRGGLTTVGNRLTPIALSHGTADQPVPFVLSQIYVKANADLGKPVPFKLVEGGPHGVWGHYEEMVAFMTGFTSPPVVPTRGVFVVAGYLKTRRFQVILPSIDAITDCAYDLSAGLAVKLSGGLPGVLRVRLPAGAAATCVKCSAGAGLVDVDQRMWHAWREYQFHYDGKRAEMVISR